MTIIQFYTVLDGIEGFSQVRYASDIVIIYHYSSIVICCHHGKFDWDFTYDY